MSDPSKPVPLDDVVVEAAAKAISDYRQSDGDSVILPISGGNRVEDALPIAQAAIHAFLEAMGVTVERTAAYTKGDLTVPAGTYIDYQPQPDWQETTPFYRLSCSRWFPIKGASR